MSWPWGLCKGEELFPRRLQIFGYRWLVSLASKTAIEDLGKPIFRDQSDIYSPLCTKALMIYDYKARSDLHLLQAEVTGGGVKLNEMDCATLESRKYPGLHMCGEILDVFGRIGGFNFYWAWLSGRIAGIGSASWRARADPPTPDK